MIPFNIPPIVGTEMKNITDSIESGNLSGDGPFSKKCEQWFEKNFNIKKALLTPSCTAALELAAILINIQPDDEVIMPSYTFVSTANAFALRGAKIVFVDIRPDTMNIDENKIESAITSKTKAIVPVHYAGIACEMDTIMKIANQYGLYVIEDAAQGVMSTYKDKPLGSIGHIGCYSFHETKNYSSGGEGGAILVNSKDLIEKAEVIREKGTNRSQFLHGLVDKYTWQDIGSSFLPSELQAAFLYAQLESSEVINNKRLAIWERYKDHLSFFFKKSSLPFVPDGVRHNAHMFYIKLRTNKERNDFIFHMRENGILTPFHYIPLHSSPAGGKYTKFHGEDVYTTDMSSRLVRLPIYFKMSEPEQIKVIEEIVKFIEKTT